MDPHRARNTDTLLAVTAGDRPASEALLPHVYRELRALAQNYLRGERAGHTLQPTELVHEAYLRMVDIERIDWRGKTHFFAIAARQMRRILVDHARARGAAKRGGGSIRVTLDERFAIEPARAETVLALDEALEALAAVDARHARVAELKLFAGMSSKEIALEVRVSERTVRDDWRFARAWLSRELRPAEGEA